MMALCILCGIGALTGIIAKLADRWEWEGPFKRWPEYLAIIALTAWYYEWRSPVEYVNLAFNYEKPAYYNDEEVESLPCYGSLLRSLGCGTWRIEYQMSYNTWPLAVNMSRNCTVTGKVSPCGGYLKDFITDIPWYLHNVNTYITPVDIRIQHNDYYGVLHDE